MKLKKTIFSISVLVVVCSLWNCSSNFNYKIETSDHAVTIDFDSTVVQIEIINDYIVHVKKKQQYTEASGLPDLITVLEPGSTDWNLTESKHNVTIETSKLKISVDTNGVIKYLDKEGGELLSESPKSTHKKSKRHTVSQSFNSGDEGLYGLGQFQSGIMNWKNTSVRLQQYNQEIAVPFLVSTNNYGIYWHNYSITDFNYPENEMSFSKTLDSAKNIRETYFSPEQSGIYTFFVESENPIKNRFYADLNVIIDSDTIIHYSTVWVPDCFSGKKMLEKGKTYKVVFQNTGSQIIGKLLYNKPDFNKTTFSSIHGEVVDYYFIHGNNPTEVISNYHHLTGKAPMYEKSVFGFWQCRERYHNQNELLENAQEYRKRNIPIDNIVQDWNYWPSGSWGPEWSRELYPNPKAMIDELKEMNYKLMVSVWPRLSNKPLSERYSLDSLESNSNLDFFNEFTQNNYYQMLKDSMFDNGVSYIWLDGTEPEQNPGDSTPTTLGIWKSVENIYSLMVCKAVYEGKMKDYPNRRVFNLTRSAYAGQQRYGATSWSGDVASTWEQFREQIPAGLNFMMAGVPYWTTDIGGFFRDSKSFNPIYDDQYSNKEFIELLTRWFQFGTFNPIFRIHGFRSQTEVWRYGKEFEEVARKFIDIRYQLLPYIYSEARKLTTSSKLLMSPLVYQFPNDKNTWEVKDQFFFGESLLVCPVTQYKARSRKLYLPKGDWYNYWSGKKIEGGRTIEADAPLDEVPLYVKAGSIIPMGPKIQYSTQKTEEPLCIKIFPGKDAKYVLYLDDNESNNYKKGEFSEIILNYSDSKKSLNIENGKGTFINFEKNPEKLTIELLGSAVSEKVTFKGESLTILLR